MWYPTPQNPHTFVMHHKPTIIRQVYDATKQSPTLTKQEKNQNSIPMARKVGHFMIAFLSLSFIISSCTSYQHPDLEIRQLGFQLTPEQDTYLDTANAFVVLETIRGTKHKLDSLLTWTDMLKDHDEERALIFANEAYRLATEKNYRLSRAIAMSYRALLKGNEAILGEGVKDALADAKISKELLQENDPIDWQAQIYGLLGYSFYQAVEMADSTYLDSAEHFSLKAYQLANESKLVDQNKSYFIGQIQIDLANIYAVEGDSSLAMEYFKKSIANTESSNNLALLSRVWRAVGVFYTKEWNLSEAEGAFTKSLNYGLKANEKTGLINTYQRLGDLKNTEFMATGQDSFFSIANVFLNKCLDFHFETSDSSTLYYTYLILGYNYNVKAEQLQFEPFSDYSLYVDSTLTYYRLAMEEAAKVGALKIMPSAVRNISTLCSDKKKITGTDCEELILKAADEYYFEFINENYGKLVGTISDVLINSNQRIRRFEKNQAEAATSYHVNRNWLISAGGLLIAGLIFLIVLQIQQQKRLQARMDALRAQINPHFMSNSLNAIENLVNRKENAAAAKYLIHFSRLSRKILTSSRNAITTLSEELKTLEHFLALEQLRFRDKLRYEVTIAEDLNPKLTQIPSLILQPYVENAIWHGIKPKKEPSLLKITAEKENKMLKCTIEDDGVGREKAQEVKDKSVLIKHKSQGMKITEERLQKIGKVKGSKVAIIDLYDEQGKPCGTRVIIRMPLKEA